MSKKPKTFDELWEELKNDKAYGDQFRFIDRVVNQDKENERLKHQLAEKDKELQKEKDALNWYQKDYAKQMEDLAETLAEKDKEIERLTNYLTLEKCLVGARCDGKPITKLQFVQKFIDGVRHEICEEIKEAISQEKLNVEYEDSLAKRMFNEIICKQFVEDKKSFVALIDRFEKGE